MIHLLSKGPSGFECRAGGLGGGWVFDGLKKFTKVGKNSIFSTLWQRADLSSFIRSPQYTVVVRKMESIVRFAASDNSKAQHHNGKDKGMNVY